MKTRILFFAFLYFLIGCTVDEDNQPYNGLPYYQFTNEEKAKLLNPLSVNDNLIYRNQDNSIITFKINYSFRGKTSEKRGCWVRCYDIFHYDIQHIQIYYTSANQYSSSLELKIRKYPIGHNYDIHPPSLGTPTFMGNLKIPLWNGTNSIQINFNQPTFSMTFNNKTYTKVRIFESNSLEILNPDAILPLLPKNVYKIYYDDNHGVIGFDDLNDKNWRLE